MATPLQHCEHLRNHVDCLLPKPLRLLERSSTLIDHAV